MNNLTITMSGYGTSRESYRIDFRPPCLTAPSWLMLDNMQISFRLGADGTDVPILAFHVGTGLGIPRNAAVGILLNGIPVSEMEHILITIEPIPEPVEGDKQSLNPNDFEDRKYSLLAFLKRSGENVECLFTKTVEYPSTLAFDFHDCRWLSEQLVKAVERVEAIGAEEWA